MAHVRTHLAVDGQLPCRRTWQRRLPTLSVGLSAIIGVVGRWLVEQLGVWSTAGRAVALDSTLLRAQGGVWQVKQREQNLLPIRTIDVQADWSKSGWHGWVYGWKLHLAVVYAGCWIPVAAVVARANEHDQTHAPALLAEAPSDTRLVLGDSHYRAEAVTAACEARDCAVVTPKPGAYPHHDDGVEVRRVLHRHRSITGENFNELFKGLFDLHGQVPTRGKLATTRHVLGAILVYQLALLAQHQLQLPLNIGLKAWIKAA